MIGVGVGICVLLSLPEPKSKNLIKGFVALGIGSEGPPIKQSLEVKIFCYRGLPHCDVCQRFRRSLLWLMMMGSATAAQHPCR